MEIPTQYSIENRTAGSAEATGRSPNELGRDAFLQLLVRQLENQNPLSPLQDHEFVSQLATFSSLEQLESINQGIQVSVLMNQAVNNSLATNLIGKEVLAKGETVTVAEEGEVSFRLELAADADVSVILRDETGNVVRRLDVGRRTAGSSDVTWDGRDENGERVAAGSYRVEVTATDDRDLPVASQTRMRALVEGVRFVDGAGWLVVGGSTIPLSDVEEVLAPIGG